MNLEMRNLLAQASVIAEGPSMNWGSRTSHGKAGAALLVRNGDALYDVMLRKFRDAHTPDQIRRATDWAKLELHRARRTPQPESGMAEVGSTAWKREIAAEADKERGDGEKAKDHIAKIARRFSVSRASVYRYRDQYSERGLAA